MILPKFACCSLMYPSLGDGTLYIHFFNGKRLGAADFEENRNQHGSCFLRPDGPLQLLRFPTSIPGPAGGSCCNLLVQYCLLLLRARTGSQPWPRPSNKPSSCQRKLLGCWRSPGAILIGLGTLFQR